MGKFVGSIGMIRHPVDIERRWLCRWDPRFGHFSFIFAERLGDDSFRECLDRELGWVLPLRRGRDYLISSMARIHLETELETETDQKMQFFVELYVVDLYGKQGIQAIDQADDLAWLSSSELMDGKTSEMCPVDATLVKLIRQGGVFHPRYLSGQ